MAGPAGAAPPIPVDAGVSVSVSKQETDGRSAAQDLSFQYSRFMVEEARSQALGEFRREHGTDATEADRQEILQSMAESVHSQLAGLSRDIREETESAQEGHDVDPTSKGNVSRSSDYNPGYPASR